MKNRRFLPVWALALALGLALGAAPLIGCSSKDSSDEATPAEQTADTTEDETDATDDATSDATDAEATEDEVPAQEAVWVVTRLTSSYRAGDFDSDTVDTYELDEQGNTVRITYDNGEEADFSTTEYTFDEDGFVTGYASNTEGIDPVTIVVEKDDQGREIKSTEDNGDTVETSYDEAGNIIQRVYAGASMTMDQDGNWIPNGTYRSVATYNADGFPVSREYQGNGYSQLTDYQYDLDEGGRVISATVSMRQGDGNDFEEEASTVRNLTFEYDEDSNIVRVSEEGDEYSYVSVYEYTLIENPSLAVRLESHLKNL